MLPTTADDLVRDFDEESADAFLRIIESTEVPDESNGVEYGGQDRRDISRQRRRELLTGSFETGQESHVVFGDSSLALDAMTKAEKRREINRLRPL